jgi:hypothetical protein
VSSKKSKSKSKRKRSDVAAAAAVNAVVEADSSSMMAPCNGSEAPQAKRATTAIAALSPLVTAPAALSAGNNSAKCFAAAVNSSPANTPIKLLAAQCAAHEKEQQQQQQQHL